VQAGGAEFGDCLIPREPFKGFGRIAQSRLEAAGGLEIDLLGVAQYRQQKE
jgi:hypothetical protein